MASGMKEYLRSRIGDNRGEVMQPVVFTDLEDVDMWGGDDFFDYDSLHVDVFYVLVGCVIAYVMS
jgi:hypothetical protein